MKLKQKRKESKKNEIINSMYGTDIIMKTTELRHSMMELELLMVSIIGPRRRQLNLIKMMLRPRKKSPERRDKINLIYMMVIGMNMMEPRRSLMDQERLVE